MAAKSKKKKILKTVSVVDISCSHCIKPTLSSFLNLFSKKPKPPSSSSYRHYHSSSISSATPSSTPLSTAAVAVEKDSDDPYLDFRQSMLQMILENHIYTKDELRELLQCFLSINSHYHHGIIVRAFSEIWEDVSSAAASAVQASPLVTRHVSRASRDYYNNYY
ncbi:PREDICTED: transcription repressor OFP6-like [Camelina sativa]|uniref:Transcription repressor n=1 Tax=Camelina sativa TaxID=90675 RepID=A0ABM0TIE9_CAMSA|nr:PREDICTED: transcription repressor OFP6-like [Camelina sativa]